MPYDDELDDFRYSQKVNGEGGAGACRPAHQSIFQ